MRIRILELLGGAREASGLTVIIDVFRAFTAECYMKKAGAAHIYPVGAVETARRLREEHPDWLLCGERHGVRLPGFEFGNSPTQFDEADITGRTVIHTTSSGTQGIISASGASEILTGSLVNAAAIARYIKKSGAEDVSLVCMGVEGVRPAPEDELCAKYIRSLLEGTELDRNAELDRVFRSSEGQKFFDPGRQDVYPEPDYRRSTEFDKFDFILRVKKISEDVFESEAEAV